MHMAIEERECVAMVLSIHAEQRKMPEVVKREAVVGRPVGLACRQERGTFLGASLHFHHMWPPALPSPS